MRSWALYSKNKIEIREAEWFKSPAQDVIGIICDALPTGFEIGVPVNDSAEGAARGEQDINYSYVRCLTSAGWFVAVNECSTH